MTKGLYALSQQGREQTADEVFENMNIVQLLESYLPSGTSDAISKKSGCGFVDSVGVTAYFSLE